jgi:integrase
MSVFRPGTILTCWPREEDYLFATEHGLPLDPDRWRKTAFKAAMQAAGLTGATPHALRHGYASLLIAKKLPLLYVSRQLGHATITMTADTYGHLLRESGDEAMATLDAAIRPNGPLTNGAVAPAITPGDLPPVVAR